MATQQNHFKKEHKHFTMILLHGLVTVVTQSSYRLLHWALCGILENRVLLMHMLEDVGSVANFITAYVESQ